MFKRLLRCWGYVCTSVSMACKNTVFKTQISDSEGPFQPAVSGADVRAASQGKGFSRTVSNSTETTRILQRFRWKQMSCDSLISRFWSSESQYLQTLPQPVWVFFCKEDWQLDLEDSAHYHLRKQKSRVKICAAFKNLAWLTFVSSTIKSSTYLPVFRINNSLK